MLMYDNRCTYQIIQKALDIGSAAIYNIFHEELHMKKVVCHSVHLNLTDHQKEEHVRISKETHKLLNDGGHCIISKIVTSDVSNILFFDVPTPQENKIWIFEDDTTPTMMKRKRALKKRDVCRYLQKYGIGQSHQVIRTEDCNSKLVYH